MFIEGMRKYLSDFWAVRWRASPSNYEYTYVAHFFTIRWHHTLPISNELELWAKTRWPADARESKQ